MFFFIFILAFQLLEDNFNKRGGGKCGHHVDTQEDRTQPNNVNTVSGLFQR